MVLRQILSHYRRGELCENDEDEHEDRRTCSLGFEILTVPKRPIMTRAMAIRAKPTRSNPSDKNDTERVFPKAVTENNGRKHPAIRSKDPIIPKICAFETSRDYTISYGSFVFLFIK